MSPRIVVVGAGYAGTALIQELKPNPDLEVIWISASPYHLVKHEIHRVIRSPEIADGLQIPITDMTSKGIAFENGRVTQVSAEDQTVHLANGTSIPFDVLAITAGARTAFYGIPGLDEHAQTLSGIDDAQAIHDAVIGANVDPLRVIVGGGGLTGIQIAGEPTELAGQIDQVIELTIVEALDQILPNGPAPLRSRITEELDARGIQTITGSPVVEATEDTVILDEDRELPVDLLIWSGGITGNNIDVTGDVDTTRNRLKAAPTLRTSDPRIFAFGDAAVIEQGDGIAPPTAQAAWQAAPTAAANIRATLADEPLSTWEFTDKGTLISIGDTAVAHGIDNFPVPTFGSYPAAFLKKAVAARWIADVDTWQRAAKMWRSL